YLRQVVLPAVFPELVWGCILAWGGAWYFIPVEEYTTFGKTQVNLPGLGNFIASAAANNRLLDSVIGLVAMVMVIIAINRVVWRPLVARTEKYRYETSAGRRVFHPRHGRLTTSLLKYEGRIATPIVSFFKYEKTNLSTFLETVPRVHVPPRVRIRLAKIFLVTRVVVIIAFLGLIYVVIFFLENSPVPTIQTAIAEIESFQPIPNCSDCPGGFTLLGVSTLSSLLRLSTAYLIALGWTLLAGIAIARRQRLAKFLIPLFDIGQSIPATALFPIVTLLILSQVPSPLGIQFASIVLLLTGMQWYLLFNIIGAVHNIPNDISESAASYGVTGKRFIREILIPASYPAIIIGSIQAWGGGWNATIISEYISSDKQVLGLGAVLDNAASAGSTVVIAATLVIMTVTVLIINRVVWHRLLKKSEKYKFEY
ncbi:MAG TPA: ABC transporter permease subunit, partial [Candidatus Binatus sp.]|nr:ABC transporter permease subunit [Candidatus Binatus sp.]